MNTITLDHTNVSPEIHKTFIDYAKASGYKTVISKKEADEVYEITVPTFYLFDISEDSNINKAIEDFPQSSHCARNINKFDEMLITETAEGGFLPIGKDFNSQDVSAAIEALRKVSGEDFYLGKAHEAVLFLKQNKSNCPKYFVAQGTVRDDKVIVWREEYTGFDLENKGGIKYKSCKVFVVKRSKKPSLIHDFVL